MDKEHVREVAEKIEDVARIICADRGLDPDALEPGDLPRIDGHNAKGEPCHYLWRQFTKLAARIVKETHTISFYYVVGTYSHTDKRQLWTILSRPFVLKRRAEDWCEFQKKEPEHKKRTLFVVALPDMVGNLITMDQKRTK